MVPRSTDANVRLNAYRLCRDEEHVQTIEGSSAMEVLVKVGVFTVVR